jgi:hypothetical protein
MENSISTFISFYATMYSWPILATITRGFDLIRQESDMEDTNCAIFLMAVNRYRVELLENA